MRGYRVALAMVRSGLKLIAVVPDVGCDLPVATVLLPHHVIFARNFLRSRTFGLQAESPDLARRRRPDCVHVDGYKLRIGDLLRHVLPHCLDRGSSLFLAGTWREGCRVVGVVRGSALVVDIH